MTFIPSPPYPTAGFKINQSGSYNEKILSSSIDIPGFLRSIMKVSAKKFVEL